MIRKGGKLLDIPQKTCYMNASKGKYYDECDVKAVMLTENLLYIYTRCIYATQLLAPTFMSGAVEAWSGSQCHYWRCQLTSHGVVMVYLKWSWVCQMRWRVLWSAGCNPTNLIYSQMGRTSNLVDSQNKHKKWLGCFIYFASLFNMNTCEWIHITLSMTGHRSITYSNYPYKKEDEWSCLHCFL